MLVLRVEGEDVANMRFAVSPLVEVYCSALALEDPASRALHLPWISTSRELVPERDLELLQALQPRNVYAPDFVHPPPSSPLASLEDELAQMLATPADQIRYEIRNAYARKPLPEILNPFVRRPELAVARLAEVIRSYWGKVLAPYWERIRALLEGDVLYRARQIADGGVRRLLSDLHDQVRFENNSVLIDKRPQLARDLEGQGLLLVPSAFVWPKLGAIVEPPWQPTLIYPARGVGMLWEHSRAATPTTLARLLGERRTRVLADLDAPRSTTDIALRLGLSPPSVSQHLAALRNAGLVHPSRVGRAVLYMRTPRGDELLRVCA
jgi:DNA-binding transcriptional ArsR family regulator